MKKIKMFLFFLMAFVLLVPCFIVVVNAAGIGACVHTSHGNDIDKNIESAKDTSLTYIRDELLWTDVEKVKGELFLPFNYEWVDKANEQGIKPLVILAFGNPLYEAGKVTQEEIDAGAATVCAIPVRDGKAETTADDEYFDAYINYVDFISKEMKGKVAAYEIWNEPDIKYFNAKDATAKEYVELLKTAYNTIKDNDPDALVLGGALAFNGNFLDEMIAAGAGEYMDAFSFHYYLGKDAPEGNARERLDEKSDILSKYGYDKMPIWVTESGWANSDVDEQTQANYIIRNAVLYEGFLLEKDIDGQYISYELHDSNVQVEQLGGSKFESSLGLVKNDYSPKLAATAVDTYNRLTADKKLVDFKEIKFGLIFGKATYAAEFKDGNNTVWAIWSENDKNIKINLPATETKIYGLDGKVIETVNDSGLRELSTSETPIFIEFTSEASITRFISITSDVIIFVLFVLLLCAIVITIVLLIKRAVKTRKNKIVT